MDNKIYLEVVRNIGAESFNVFGGQGSLLEINGEMVYCKSHGKEINWLSRESRLGKEYSMAEIANYNSEKLYGSEYKTIFKINTGLNVFINDVKYPIETLDKVLLYEFISKSIILKSNPIITYNGDEINPNNKLNELIRLRDKDIVGIAYEKDIMGICDVSSLVDK